MTKHELRLIEESIDHWKRMIAWAEKQDKKEHPESMKMKYYIGESWAAKYCALCDEYIGNQCFECPLDTEEINCCYYDSPYMNVINSITWGEWLINARKMLEVLEGLR